MNQAFSVYLDLVRFSAAILVYLYHSNQRFLSTAILPASEYGHSSVIVFFVLSGFVIAYVAANKERQFSIFAASRISRVYSVAVPAVILTLLLDSSGRALYPEIYAAYPYDEFALRTLGSLLMANEIWFVSITSFSNVPYWSIGYEWWYYVSFTLIVFLPFRWGLPLAVLAFLVIGPKLILLAPIWWLGVLLYRWKALAVIPRATAWLIMVVATLAIILFHYFNINDIATEWLSAAIGSERHRQLTFSKFFIADYLLAVLVFANFTGMRVLLKDTDFGLLMVMRPIRYVAGFTFTLYLLHQPMLLFWGAVLRGDPSGLGFWLTVTALTFLSVMVIGHYTESKRFLMRNAILRGFERLRCRYVNTAY